MLKVLLVLKATPDHKARPDRKVPLAHRDQRDHRVRKVLQGHKAQPAQRW